MINDIIIIILIVALVLNFSLSVFLAFKNKRLNVAISQLTVDKVVLMNNLEEANLVNDEATNQEFIKFLSKSRDWAFGYIDDVQNAISKYNYETIYGNPESIGKARKELFDMLPDDRRT